MALTAKITFYEIHQCGYYKYKEKDAPVFGGINETLLDLEAWVKPLSFEATKTFDSDDGKTLPVYLLGLRQGKESWLLATWNQVPSSEVGVSSVARTSTLDKIKVFANSIEENSIPGFPTYFWIFPSLKSFATICFDVYNGKDGFQNYLDSFLAFNPNHRFEYKTKDKEVYYIYKATEDSQHGKGKISPFFRSALHRKKGKIQFLLKNFSKITKVTRKATVNITNTVELAGWQKALRCLKFTCPEEIVRGRKQDGFVFHTKTEIDAKFDTDKPLKQIIGDWSNEQSKTSWDDYGFLLRGEQTPIWLSQSLARDKFELPIATDDYGLIDLQSLLDELENRQHHILKIRDED